MGQMWHLHERNVLLAPRCLPFTRTRHTQGYPEISRCYSLTRPPSLSPPRLCTCKPKGIYVHLCGISACLCPTFVMLYLEFNVVILMDFYQRETSHFTFSFLLSRQKVLQRSSSKLSTAGRQLGPLVYSSASRSASVLSSCCLRSSLDYFQWQGPFCCKAWSARSTASSEPVGPTSLVISVPFCFQREE